MNGKPISQLPLAQTLDDQDLLVLVQGGITKRITGRSVAGREFVSALQGDSVAFSYQQIGFDNPKEIQVLNQLGDVVEVALRISGSGVQIASNVSLNLHTLIIRR